APAPCALSGIRIIELASRISDEFCGKLLADFGAEVSTIDPPTGADTRHIPPFSNGESTLFTYLNTNKKSIILDPALPADRATLHRLLASAHGLIDGHDRPWGEAATHRHLIHLNITPFGQSAPPDWQIARPINVINAGGWAWHTPSESAPDMPPLMGAGPHMADFEAGIDAALAMAAALYHQRQTGTGQAIDLSQLQVQLSRADCVLGRMLAGDTEASESRTAYDMGGPAACFPAKNGFLYIIIMTKAHWLALVGLMGNPTWADEFPDDWLEYHCTPARVANFRAKFAPWAAVQDKNAISEAGQRLGVAIVPVNSAEDLPYNLQFIHRGFFQTLPASDIALPTTPYRLSASPTRIHTPAPSLGQHTKELSQSTPLPTPDPLPTLTPLIPSEVEGGVYGDTPSRGGPLSGIRILALTKVWAGPYACKLLAQLGAEVIKVESRSNLDEMRGYGGVDPDSAPYFLSINQDIRSVQVDMKSLHGLELIHKMVAKSDIVIDNLRPGALERSGLTYENLRKIKPDIIQLAIKMWGSTGPLAYQTGYAPCFAALSGLNYLVGFEGETPRGMNIRYGDSTVGAFTALAAVAALHHRSTTGKGQFVDVSAVEAMSCMVGDALAAYGFTGQVPQASGNAAPHMSPHGCYPCQNRGWISIAVASNAEWAALGQMLGSADFAGDKRFATTALRQTHRLALDTALALFTETHDAATLAEHLRAVGVAAFASAHSLDLISDEFLWASGGYRQVTDHQNTTRPIIGPSWRMQPFEAQITRGAPNLGEDNHYIYRDLLGLSQAEYEDYITRKIIE
ncbi:MAG: hypothetical protein RLY97_1754, partial [Pseudomonadota bacterium]